MQTKRMNRILLVAGNGNKSQPNIQTLGIFREGMNTSMGEADNYETLLQNMSEKSQTAGDKWAMSEGKGLPSYSSRFEF